MPLLYYWHPENYRRDLDMGAGFHLNQSNPLLHSIDIGDSLWAFTRNRSGRYVLAAELIVKAKTQNPPSFRYGPYRIWGELSQSRYFLADESSPSAEQVLRSLSIKANATRLGQSFEGHAAVRTLTEADQQVLTALATNLALEPRARLLPEERLEALLLLEDDEAVEQLLKEEAPGIAETRAYQGYGPIEGDKPVPHGSGLELCHDHIALHQETPRQARSLCQELATGPGSYQHAGRLVRHVLARTTQAPDPGCQ